LNEISSDALGIEGERKFGSTEVERSIWVDAQGYGIVSWSEVVAIFFVPVLACPSR
jgi:hypothetical protein